MIGALVSNAARETSPWRGRGSFSRRLPLGEGPEPSVAATRAPRPKGGGGRRSHDSGPSAAVWGTAAAAGPDRARAVTAGSSRPWPAGRQAPARPRARAPARRGAGPHRRRGGRGGRGTWGRGAPRRGGAAWGAG